ncbi:glycosyltransferase [Streptomyces turgidiscabies]|uniref:D-inositol 3-phosphate glycosyltransferase n=1 Tax=Streptomyces turgidiscabies (strain Car8) TaxID=698760 RepID=L7F7I3_STRT8|nr:MULTISPECIES: glycosyltransferase [Streptomyces]ELP66615.1 glycosyltransferase, group 1 family protein [Streptomyces turgidiscabies Car8]MDX3494835.1 glycosyltransferase [Streptomyces turgidiscabies]GAQ71447.1 putative poly(glycerol-phosphate) alpha-glucosyltransferase [Streptomyces turgidiscabies]
MRIAFLLHNAYAMGGTVRTTVTLADTLAERHQVELVSVFRHRERPQLGRSAEVPLRALVDRREGSADVAAPSARRAGEVFPKGDSRSYQYHQLAEQRVIDWLRETDADVVVGTRAGLNALLARFGPRHAVRVGQEHLTHDNHPHRLRTELQRWYGGLDALVTMTEADARDHLRGLRLPRTRVLAIPNSVPEPPLPPADPAAKVVVAAGRLARVKRYEMLVDAFALAGAACPDWSLRIYGDGAERVRIADRIAHHGLGDRVFLMGSATPIEAEWVKGSIAAVTSAHESFGMTIVEAMRCGLPVVSTDCPHGPGEIIRHGVDGWLVPRDSTRGVADALLALMRDDGRRAEMGRAARAGAAKRFTPDGIADRYERLFSTLVQERAARSAAPPPGLADWRDRGTVFAATAGILARGAVRRARRKLGWVG